MKTAEHLHFVATHSDESLTVEVLKHFNESYTERGIAGTRIPCQGVRILAWAHFQNGKRLLEPLPFTTLLKGNHVTEFRNGIRTLQFRG